MDFLPVIGIAFGLAMDAFSVAVATGMSLGDVTHRQSFRLSFHFGLFQFLMPVFGWLTGKMVEEYISAFDHWFAFVILFYVGAKMIHDALSSDGDAVRGDPTRGLSLLVLSVATSIDAFAVGLTLGLIGGPIVEASVVIGIVAAAMTFVGLKLGKHAGDLLGQRMEIVGGLVLIAIGVKIVLDHTLG